MAHIIVCGYMIRHPVAGNLLAFFHYVLGLHLLGYKVVYLEESGWPQSCYDPLTYSYSDDPQTGLGAVQALMNDYGVMAKVCYVNRDSGTVYGADWEELKLMLSTADLLLNIGGVCWLPEFLLCKRRVLIDMDPFFTQIGQFAVEGRNDYHLYFSYGANIGRFNCTIPVDDGIDWLPTVPPVVPEIWRRNRPAKWSDASKSNWVEERKNVNSLAPHPSSLAPLEADAPLTTIANWSAYGETIYQGESYGQKEREFMRLLELPRYCSQKLELAISAGDTEIAEIAKFLQTAGWSVRDGRALSADLSRYRTYITDSWGEFSVAKHAYVKTRSGWFSDRSVCYLAAGRPVILQDTGFSDWLPTGRGALAFSSLESAVECIERVNADYPAQSLAARELAELTFSYTVVLPRLLETDLITIF